MGQHDKSSCTLQISCVIRAGHGLFLRKQMSFHFPQAHFKCFESSRRHHLNRMRRGSPSRWGSGTLILQSDAKASPHARKRNTFASNDFVVRSNDSRKEVSSSHSFLKALS